jgi:hypothetical protein
LDDGAVLLREERGQDDDDGADVNNKTETLATTNHFAASCQPNEPGPLPDMCFDIEKVV